MSRPAATTRGKTGRRRLELSKMRCSPSASGCSMLPPTSSTTARTSTPICATRERVSAGSVARLMSVAGLRGVSRRRGFVVTTQRDRKQRPAPDLVNQEFSAAPAALGARPHLADELRGDARRKAQPTTIEAPTRVAHRRPVRGWRHAGRGQPCTDARHYLRVKLSAVRGSGATPVGRRSETIGFKSLAD